MSLEQFATSLGLPGLLILVWYLLEIQKGRRAEKVDDARAKLEDRKIEAMTLGFTALNTQLDTHERAEFEHHAKTREVIVSLHAAIANQFDMTPPPHEPPKQTRNTPGRGTEYHHRAGTKGGER